MNVIIITRNGVMETPHLVADDTTAQATFDIIAETLLGDDISEIDLHSDHDLDQVNELLRGTGTEINWFVDIDVNNFKNK